MRNHNNHSMETTATTDHDARPARREPGTGNRLRVLAAFVLAGAALARLRHERAGPNRSGHTDESHGHDEQQDADQPLLDGADEHRRYRHFDYRLQDRIFRPGLLASDGIRREGEIWGVLEENTGSTSTSYNHDHVLAPDTGLEVPRLGDQSLSVRAIPRPLPKPIATQAAPDTAGNGAPDRMGSTVNHREYR